MSVTALFGGSFDPVHMGHINAVKSLLRHFPEITRVIIMPAFVNPFKCGNEPRAAVYQRLEMCKLAFSDIPCCIVSDMEISRGGSSYTVITLEHLREKYPHDRLILTVGSDSLESLPRWYRAADIMKMADIAAIARSDTDMQRAAEISDNAVRAGARVTLVPTAPFEISSTEIRKKILNNDDISCYVPENVVKYIRCNKIYG